MIRLCAGIGLIFGLIYAAVQLGSGIWDDWLLAVVPAAVAAAAGAIVGAIYSLFRGRGNKS